MHPRYSFKSIYFIIFEKNCFLIYIKHENKYLFFIYLNKAFNGNIICISRMELLLIQFFFIILLIYNDILNVIGASYNLIIRFFVSVTILMHKGNLW